jgi:hypothetical protein
MVEDGLDMYLICIRWKLFVPLHVHKLLCAGGIVVLFVPVMGAITQLRF